MKGIVFTQFLNHIEDQFGYPLVDSLLLTTDLPSGGVYTSTGTYPPEELNRLVAGFSQASGQSQPETLRHFGQYLFGSFLTAHEHFILTAPDAFAFLASVPAYIHVEVQKLYPEAELPHFTIAQPDANTLHMRYQSTRRMADLAYGLIQGTLAHFNEQAQITCIPQSADGSLVDFIIVRQTDDHDSE
ncbi:heme NO-binding domain-containing protein [Spirosoma sordidisoli]|uniref:Heme NO-binding domain-containing protein n=1 Tax=Spirosoma sordidisoli TaxID=2502893 RepID=A0A4Q2UGS0_9BACT|nr:heme NO-binding domain-containing protein [Spirosoma sordidisoli]RYC66625.1 hypothetical protein EQG79_28965 [Spirosoma sordidisoli]